MVRGGAAPYGAVGGLSDGPSPTARLGLGAAEVSWMCVGAPRMGFGARARSPRPSGHASSSTGARSSFATIYGEGRTPMNMNAEDLSEIERVGHRCGVCRSGRGWRRFEIVRRAEREPVVLCGSCRARFGDDPPVASHASPSPSWCRLPPLQSCSRGRSLTRASAGPTGARIASERRLASCRVRSRRRWPPGRQA